MIKKAKITVRSSQNITLPLTGGEEDLQELPLFSQPAVTEVESEGELIYEGGVFRIEYPESEATGLENCVTSVSFTRGEPGRVTVYRSGPVKTALMFCGGERYISVYDTGYGSFEVGIYTESCENGIDFDGGVLSVVYTVEIRGSETEHTELELKVRITDEENGHPADTQGRRL